jgi:hypothetical protein
MPSVQDLAALLPVAPTRQLLQQLRTLRGDRELVTLVVGNSNLHPSYVEPFYEALAERGKHESLDLLLHTTGGQAEVPWALVSLLREYADHLAVLVPFRAMSGGTHVALAGEELVMGPVSCLGSVDPKRTHHLLPKEDVPDSVQDLKHCMDFIDRQWVESGGLLERALTKRARSRQIGAIVTSLFDHVHPLAIGALEQSFELSRLITRKVLAGRKDFTADDPRIKRIEDRLAGEYFSHSFFIFRDDVEKDLQLPVMRPTEDVWAAMRTLDAAYRSQFTMTSVQHGGAAYTIEPVAFIETASRRRVRLRFYEGPPKPDNARAEDWVEV